jgi:hypothetical protein
VADVATDLQAAAAALEEGRSYAARERERRIGVTYVLSGTATALIFTTYGLLQLFDVQLQVVYAVAWLPFIALITFVRRRFFRFLPTRPEQLWGLPQGLWLVFVALFVAAPFLLSQAGIAHEAWPAEGLLMALLYAAQAVRGRDRLHGAFAGFVALVALAASALPLGWQALTMGVAIGVTLVALGLLRVRRSRS